nr:MAG TPA: hypothetical protein [Caudoviricetes sp.]
MNGRYDRTPHLALPLYTDDAPMDLRDGYNEAMRALDQKIHHLETLIRETKENNR